MDAFVSLIDKKYVMVSTGFVEKFSSLFGYKFSYDTKKNRTSISKIKSKVETNPKTNYNFNKDIHSSVLDTIFPVENNIICLSNTMQLVSYSKNGDQKKSLDPGRVAHFKIYHDWIYYKDVTQIPFSIYRIKTNGSSNKEFVLNDNVEYFEIYNDWIYYTKNENINGNIISCLYKMNINDGRKILIDNTKDIGELYIFKNWLYYSTNFNRDIHRMNLDTYLDEFLKSEVFNYIFGFSDKYLLIFDTKSVVLFDLGNLTYSLIPNVKPYDSNLLSTNTEASGRQFDANGEWIYYSRYGGNMKIYRIAVDGSERKIISQHSCEKFCIEGEWIYYFSNKGQSLFKVKVDGSSEVKIY